jgi:hypothetical protein
VLIPTGELKSMGLSVACGEMMLGSCGDLGLERQFVNDDLNASLSFGDGAAMVLARLWGG